MLRFCLLLLLLAGSVIAEARVFDYKDSSLAAYVRGTGAMSLLGQDAFGNARGNGVVFDKTSKYNYGAELGFVLGFGADTHLRLGAEIIQYHQVDGEGSSSGGTKYYDLTSSVFVFNPNVVLEQVLKVSGSTRFWGALGVGYANVTAVNDFRFTSAGSTALGVTDFKETMDTNVLSGTLSVGLETLFTDNVTFLAETGYRYLPVKQLKYKNDLTGFGGAVAAGDVVENTDGTKRTMNLGGMFAGVAFRFYLNFL